MKSLLEQILLARVYDVAVESPLELASRLSVRLGNNIYLKREDLQPVHSFKLRGAYNKIANLSDAQKAKGIIAASAGNHAQGVALSAQKLGLSALIVMPKTTPEIKIQAVKGYGAEVVLFGDNYSEAYEHCQSIIKETKRVFVHPFDDMEVIAGQGTIGREIVEQLPDTSHILVPVGGGGLLAGVAAYVKQLKPSIKVIGVEPKDSDAMAKSLKANDRVILKHVGIFADGVAVKQVGEQTFRLARKYVDDVITVSTDEVCAAIKDVFEETRSILEPAGALSVAGASRICREHSLQGNNMVAICSGANMTFERLQFIAERTLTGSGREALFAIELGERPGTLRRLCEKVINGYGITEFSYRLHRRKTAYVFAGISVTGGGDKQKFISNLRRYEYQFTDLSDDDLAKEHVRHMIGGHSSSARNEHIYQINFPERPGALTDFLTTIADRWNISLFHYRGQGGDIGRVLIGFESLDVKSLERALENTGYDFVRANSASAKIFL